MATPCTPQSLIYFQLADWYIAPPTAVPTEDTSLYPAVPTTPAVAPIDTGGAPPTYTQQVAHTTTWPLIEVTIPTVPDFDIPNAQEVEPPQLPAVVTEDEVTTEIEEAIWSGTWTPSTRVVSIPSPPSINLEIDLPDVPTLTIEKPVDSLDWIYEVYSSDLLQILISSAASLLTQGLPIASTDIVTLTKKMWNTPSNFLSARNITNLSHREAIKSQRYKDNIDRLIAILEAQYQDMNDKNYVKYMQALENLNIDIHEAKKRGELLYAKEYQQVKLMEYEAEIISYNNLLSVYRAQSIRFEAEIKEEQDKLTKYQMDIDALRKEGEVNSQLVREYLAQIEVVNTIIDSYKLSMEVARAVSNIAILNTELENLNVQNSVLRSRLLVKLADNEVEFKKVELALKEILDADVDYGRVLLEKELAELDRLIAISDEELGTAEHNIESSKANSVRDNIITRVESFYNLVVSQLNNMSLKATEDRAGRIRAVAKMNLKADLVEDQYITEGVVVGDTLRMRINTLMQNPRQHYLADLEGAEEVYEAEYDAASLRASASIEQTLNHEISST
jgi:hypothetical protein